MYRSASKVRLLLSIGLLALIGFWAFGCGTGGIKSPESASRYGYEAYGDNGSGNARPMADGIMQTGYVEYVGDSDWYALDSGLTDEIDVVTLRVELSNQTLSSAVDLSVAVYGDVDEEVGNNDLVMIGGHYDAYGGDGMTQITLEFIIEDYQTCYIVVRDHLSNESDPINPYFLTASLFTGPGDGNNSPATATVLDCGTALEDSISTLRDLDWFEINMPAGSDVLALSLNMAAGSPDLVATLYDSSATTALVSFADADGSNGPTALSRNIYLPQPGIYYLAVRDSLDDDAEDGLLYTLQAQCMADPDMNETNNSAIQSVALIENIPVNGLIAYHGDQDWYWFVMPYDGLLNLALQTSAGDMDVELICTISDSTAETEAEFRIETGAAPADFSARVSLSAGLHYLRLKDENDDEADSTNTYSVQVSYEPDPDANEPNGNYPTLQQNLNNATPLVVGTPAQGYIGSNSDQDWFQVYITPGVYHLSLTNTAASEVDLSVSLYQPNGVSMVLTRQEDDRQGEDGPSTIGGQVYLYETGAYYVLVQDYGNNETDLDLPYTLEINAITLPTLPPGSIEEPNEDRSEALMITSGQEVQGYIEFEGDRDWYGVEFTSEQDVVVEIWNTAGSPVELVWFMYRPDSTEVFASDGDSTESDSNQVYIITGDDEEFWVGAENFGICLFKISDYNRNDYDTAVPYHFRVTLSPH